MDIATLGIAVESRQVDDANRSLERFSQVSGSAERAAKGVGRETTAAGRAAQAANDNAASSANKAAMAYGKWERTAAMVSRALGAVTAALATGALVSYADTWSDINARVAIAARSTEAGAAVMDRLAIVARRTYSDLALTAESYIGNATALRELGYSTLQQLDYTEALNLALVVSGARSERAASVTNALTKAMAAGKLSGDELNTVIQTGGRVAEVIAEKMGVTVNQLRAVGAEGRITGDVIYSALVGNLELLQTQAEEMPATVGDAFTLMRNSLLEYVGGIDQATGASGSLAEAIIALGDNIDIIARGAVVAGVALLTAFAPTILAAMASGFVALGTAGVAAIGAITAAIAANPLGALAVAFTTAITAAYLFRDEIKQAIGVDVVEVAIGAGNEIVGAFVGAYEGIKVAWAALPGALGDIVYSTANAVIKGVESMINSVIGLINGYLDNVRASLASLPFGLGENVSIGAIDPVAFGGVENPYAGQAQRAVSGVNMAVQNARGRNYLGGLRGAIGGDSAPDAAAMEELNRQLNALSGNAGAAGAAMDEAGKKGGSAADKAAKEAQKLADAYDKIVMKANQRITDLQNEAAALGMTEEAAARLRYEQEMMNEAQNAGITLTAAQRAELSGLAATMASVEAETKRAKDQLDFAKGSTNSFLSDLRSGLNQGKGFFESFGTAALNVLDKIIDKLQGQFVDALFGATSGGGKGGSGLFGGVIGAVGKLLGFSSGGWTGGGAANAAAGIVHGQEFVVRAGPAAQHRDMLEAINAGRAPANANAPAPVPQPVAITVNVEGANGDKHVMDLVRQGVTQGLSQYDRAANGSMTDKRRRGVS